MKHSEVLNRYVNTGSRIPEEQYDKLSSSLQKSYKRMRGVAGYERWEFKTLSDDEKIKFIESKGKNLLNENIDNLLHYSKNRQNIIIKIIESKGDNLGTADIKSLLEYSQNKDDTVIKIINVKGEKLIDGSIPKLLTYSDNKTDNNAIKIIELIGEKLGDYDIEHLIKNTKNKDDIATKIIDVKGEKLEPKSVQYLLDYSENKDLIATKIIEVGLQIPEKQYDILSQSLQKFYKRMRGVHGYSDWEFKLLNDNEKIKYIETKGEELRNSNIRYLLEYSNDKDLIITKIIQTKGKSLSGLDILTLFKNSEDKELIKNLLLQNGVDYKKINDSITRSKMDIPLIPDNYQETLNEIKRIKQIMG